MKQKATFLNGPQQEVYPPPEEEGIKKRLSIRETKRRIYVPKPGKTTLRPISIPNFRERILQDIIRNILNAIYEPTFQEYELNFGFRPLRSPEDALNKIDIEKQGMTTAIEGDIKGAFDNVNHKILMRLLRKKILVSLIERLITDKRFLKLIENGRFKWLKLLTPEGLTINLSLRISQRQEEASLLQRDASSQSH